MATEPVRPGEEAITSSVAPRRVPDWVILTLACVAQFMVLLDVSIVNVALPAMKVSLGFSESGLQWVLNAYTLTFAGFLLLGGRTADLFGRRRVFLIGLAVFTGASLLGGFAENQTMLIVARAVQGLGGAILSPTTLTILTTTFTEPKARTKAMGIWSAVAGAGGAAGALLGGVLTETLSWRWILFINIPIGVVAFVAARLFLQERRVRGERQPLDLPGAVLVTAGLTALVFGVVRSTASGWGGSETLGSLAAAAVLIAWFLFHEARVATAPLMPLRMFSRRSISTANLVMFLLSGALFAMWFFISLYLQQVKGWSPLRTGFAFLPQTVAIVAGAQISSRLVLRTGARLLLVIGGLLSAGGLFWLSDLGVATGYWSGFFVPSVAIALGLGLSFTPLAFAATSGVPPNEAGLASGLVNTSRQIGGAIGLAALTTVATSTMASTLGHVQGHAGSGAGSVAALLRVRAMAAGYDRAFLVSSVIALGAAVAALAVPARGSHTAAARVAGAQVPAASDAKVQVRGEPEPEPEPATEPEPEPATEPALD
ncbi:MAG: MFS transporter [Acidimicrobiales bacterium]